MGWEEEKRALEETISELNMRLASKDHDIAELHMQLEERERDLRLMHGRVSRVFVCVLTIIMCMLYLSRNSAVIRLIFSDSSHAKPDWSILLHPTKLLRDEFSTSVSVFAFVS